MKAHLINGDTYPDFTLRPAEKPTVRFNLIEAESQFQVGQYRVKPVSLKHALPALGYQITDAAGRSFFYTGDTGPLTAETWQKINPDVLIIECTAPDKFKDMMTESGHLTPALLRDQLSLFKQIHSRLPRVYTVHTNPEYEAEIREQLRAVAWDTGAEITTAHEGLIIRV